MTIWWHVYPLGFLGAEREALPPGTPPVHRLPTLVNWLDHLVDLGCDGLALGPVFASETHGYDTVDHFTVDSRLGTEEDLVHLVAEASRRGVKVLLDGVFNHVGRSFPRLEELGAPGLPVFEGHDRLVTLDHSSPAVTGYVTEVMTYWLERGVAGWRLDAAYTVPLAFWHAVTARVRARFPGAWLVGEVIHGDYAAYVAKGGLDSVTQYELWKAIWSSLNDRNLFELAWALKRHDTMLETFAPMTFVGNHDVTRIASQLDDPRFVEHALVILLTVGGVPSLYAGDELGMTGVKEHRAGGDDAIRPAFPERPGPTGPLFDLHRELIALRRQNPWLERASAAVTELRNDFMAYTVGDRLSVTLDLASGAWRVTVSEVTIQSRT
ncbi:alpha-amylase family glycosyl hydrolase [Nonomuraea sp. NPDC050556]|uniref:alpha-amylase family glycosyl hydrolase n=1 Tax=Nonomuraea sp. NPDC050556 TaxID=3364369 RepID=UPI003792D1D7